MSTLIDPSKLEYCERRQCQSTCEGCSERFDASHQLRLEALERGRRESLCEEVCNVDVCPAENDTKQLVLDEITNTKVARTKSHAAVLAVDRSSSATYREVRGPEPRKRRRVCVVNFDKGADLVTATPPSESELSQRAGRRHVLPVPSQV